MRLVDSRPNTWMAGNLADIASDISPKIDIDAFHNDRRPMVVSFDITIAAAADGTSVSITPRGLPTAASDTSDADVRQNLFSKHDAAVAETSAVIVVFSGVGAGWREVYCYNRTGTTSTGGVILPLLPFVYFHLTDIGTYTAGTYAIGYKLWRPY